MSRQRLRSNHGCTQCRARRKKCDETKPVCQACSRLRLPCRWKSLDNLGRNPTATDVAPTSQTPPPSIAHSLSLRLPDFIPVRRSDEVEFPDLYVFLEDTSMRDSGGYGYDPCSIQEFIIHGVRIGWHTIPDHPDAECMGIMDRHFESYGHGQAARIACAWMFHMLRTCFRLWHRGDETAWAGLPLWCLPQQLQTTRTLHTPSPVDFVPWPALRQRILNQPSTYQNEQFLLELSADGLRFVWPYSYAEIVVMHQETGRCQFSDEFFMRILNLRSMTLTKDFLDKYPELRGDAAQLEPSVTTYQLSEASITESIFWAKVREARHKQAEENVTQTQNLVVGDAEATSATRKR